MMADAKSRRKRERRKNRDRYFGLTLPENLPAAALEVFGEAGEIGHQDLCDRLSRIVTMHLVEIVRNAEDRPLRSTELRKIEERYR